MKFSDSIVLYPRLYGIKRNPAFLETVPYKKVYGDIAVVCHAMETKGTLTGTDKPVTHQMLKGWGMEEEDLFLLTKGQAQENLPPIMMSMLFGEQGLDMKEINKEEILQGLEDGYMIIISNLVQRFGASVIWYSNILDELYSRVGKLYLIPSSIHELICVKENMATAETLLGMVKEINHTHVRIGERLTDNVYQYDGKELKPLF